jgi:ADP-heptose:LPS heptosyltransferase
MLKLKLFICNDSGPMHMAAALGLPVVALFGPGDIAQWNCYLGAENVAIIRHRVSCSPCQKISCQNHKCMELITVTEVYEAAKKLLYNEILL